MDCSDNETMSNIAQKEASFSLFSKFAKEVRIILLSLRLAPLVCMQFVVIKTYEIYNYTLQVCVGSERTNFKTTA